MSIGCRRSRPNVDDRGAVAIVVAIFVLVAMVLLAFVVDRGAEYAARAQLQNAVDAAALAATQSACRSLTEAQVKQIAVDYAADNGVVVDPDDVDVQDGIVYVAGVSVAASQVVRTFFRPFVNSDTVAVAARATATRECIPNFTLFTQGSTLVSGTAATVTGGIYSGTTFGTNGNPDISGPLVTGGWLTPPTPGVPKISAVEYATSIGIIDRLITDRADAGYQLFTGDCDAGDLLAGKTVFECTGDYSDNEWPAGVRTLIADEVTINGGTGTIGSWTGAPGPALIVALGTADNALNFGGNGLYNGYIYVPNGGYDVEGTRDVNGRAVSKVLIEINGELDTTGDVLDYEFERSDMMLSQ